MILTVDPNNPRFSGTETITLKITDTVADIHMHSVGLDIEALTLEHGGNTISSTHRQRDQETVILPAQPLPPGDYTVKLTWSGPLDGNKMRGIYRLQSGGKYYVGSTFEATDARRMAPCFDEPAFKAALKLTLRVPKAMVAVSNGEVESEALAGDKNLHDFRDVHFAPTTPISTYLWAVMVGPFTITPGGKFNHTAVRIITTPEKAALAEGTAKIVRTAGAALEKYFDMPFPFSKLDLIALPEFGSGAMENAGAIAGREESLLLPLNGGSRNQKRQVSMTITHEMAHQWFGDLVTMAWWDDLWLNESFAEWLGITLADRADPELGTRFLLARGKHQAMEADALPSSHPIRVAVATADEARSNFDVITYQKGAAILAMLQSWLGDDIFRAGLHRYLVAHANGNATALDLFTALSDASGKEVAAVATGWITQPGYPSLSGQVDCAGKPTLKLTQKPFAVLGQTPSTGTWRVPICARDAAGVACGLVTDAPFALALAGDKCPDWIAPNAQGVGFFSYALKENAAIARGAAHLFPEERYDFVSNQWLLVSSGQQSVEQLLQALAPLRAEQHPLPLTALRGLLAQLRDELVTPETHAAFAKLAALHFGAQAKALGWKAQPGEDDLKQEARDVALTVMGVDAEDPATIATATQLAQQWLKDGTGVAADTAQTALTIFARHATAADIATMASALTDAKDPQRHSSLVASLALSHDPAAQQAGLALILGNHGVRAQDLQTVLYRAALDPVTAPAVWAWYKAHAAEFDAQVSPMAAARAPSIGATFCTAEQRADVVQWFAAHPVPMMKPRLAEALAHIDSCIALRASQGPGLAAALDKAVQLTPEKVTPEKAATEKTVKPKKTR